MLIQGLHSNYLQFNGVWLVQGLFWCFIEWPTLIISQFNGFWLVQGLCWCKFFSYVVLEFLVFFFFFSSFQSFLSWNCTIWLVLFGHCFGVEFNFARLAVLRSFDLRVSVLLICCIPPSDFFFRCWFLFIDILWCDFVFFRFGMIFPVCWFVEYLSRAGWVDGCSGWPHFQLQTPWFQLQIYWLFVWNRVYHFKPQQWLFFFLHLFWALFTFLTQCTIYYLMLNFTILPKW